MNSGNGANKIEIFDVSGKLVVNKSFSASQDTITVDAENHPKGMMYIKLGI